jgi:hypothetical protein
VTIQDGGLETAGSKRAAPENAAQPMQSRNRIEVKQPDMDRESFEDQKAFTRRGVAWSEATRLTGSAFRVRLGGPFRGAWLATLSRHLAERQISIDHTHARQGEDQIWNAEFHLIALAESSDLLSVDYIALAEEGKSPESASFELDSHRLIESRDYGGTLMLTLEAADSLGLLGSLLGALAELGLQPIEVHIETRAGRAYDSLWLAATAETNLSAACVQAEALLQAALKRKH